MKIKAKKKLVNVLRIIGTLCAIPLVFSSFFSGYNVISSGTQTNAPVGISIFEFAQQKDFLLALAFVSCVLQTILIIFNIFYGVSKITKKNPDNLIGIITIIFELILSIMPFIMVLIYCNKNSATGLSYTIGICPIFYMIFGLIFGGLMLASYLIPIKKPALQISSTKKAEAK